MKYASSLSFRVQQFWRSGSVYGHFHATLHFPTPHWELNYYTLGFLL